MPVILISDYLSTSFLLPPMHLNKSDAGVLHRHPDDDVLSSAQVKSKIAELSGVSPLYSKCVSILVLPSPDLLTTLKNVQSVMRPITLMIPAPHSKCSIPSLLDYNCKPSGVQKRVHRISDTRASTLLP